GVSLVVKVAALLQGRNSRTAMAPETAIVLAASGVVHVPTWARITSPAQLPPPEPKRRERRLADADPVRRMRGLRRGRRCRCQERRWPCCCCGFPRRRP